MLRRTLLLAAVLAAPSGAAWAQTRLVPDATPRLPAQPGQGLAAEDVRSIQRAARLSAVQVEAAGLAAERASGAEIKQLAARIGEDHARFRQALADLAATHRVDLPDRQAAGIEDRSLAALRSASGEGFDRAFLARQLGLYRPMAELYQTMASNSPDHALNRFGITALAAVRAHFETARQLGARFGLSVDTVENPPQY
jgi:predicted outer membrane protein